MDTTDSKAFAPRLSALAEIFDVTLTAPRVALYFEALRDLPLEAVVGALTQAAQTCTFFPKPAELRTFVLGDGEDRAEQAWLSMRAAMARAGAYASLSVDDAALGESILALFGSWPGACQADLMPEMWASKRKEFSRVYRVMLGRQLEGARYLAGTCEQVNAGRLEWRKYVPVYRLGARGVEALPAHEAESHKAEIAAQSHSFSSIEAFLGSLRRRLEPKDGDA